MNLIIFLPSAPLVLNALAGFFNDCFYKFEKKLSVT